MAGEDDTIIKELLDFGKKTMESYKIYPYVEFIAKNNVIVSRGFNLATSTTEKYNGDITLQGDVVAIRQAQEALGVGDLSKYSLYSLFQPTILGFDVALWAGIKRFVWCINASSLPNHYNKMHYSPYDYLNNHPGEIFITGGVEEKSALQLVNTAKQNHYYPEIV